MSNKSTGKSADGSPSIKGATGTFADLAFINLKFSGTSDSLASKTLAGTDNVKVNDLMDFNSDGISAFGSPHTKGATGTRADFALINFSSSGMSVSSRSHSREATGTRDFTSSILEFAFVFDVITSNAIRVFKIVFMIFSFCLLKGITKAWAAKYLLGGAGKQTGEKGEKIGERR